MVFGKILVCGTVDSNLKKLGGCRCVFGDVNPNLHCTANLIFWIIAKRSSVHVHVPGSIVVWVAICFFDIFYLMKFIL